MTASPQDNPSPDATPRLTPEVFAVHFRTNYPALAVVAAATVGRADADDVVQQAAIVALDRLDRFEPGTDFRAWLSAIVRGVAKNHRRSGLRLTRKHQALRDQTTTTSAEPHADGQAAPVPRVLRTDDGLQVQYPQQFRANLRNAVDALGPLQSACLLLRTVHGHTYEEISAMLDIPPATARSHVFRARARLLETLGPGTENHE